MATLVATAGAADANSYLTLAEANAYFETRLSADAWDNADDPERALMFATRVLDKMGQPYKYLIFGDPQYYRTRPQWTGAPTTTTQKLSWPRTGMLDANDNEIADTVIPQDLKDATAELALALLVSDRTLDSDISIQGITSIKAGPVSLSFKDMIASKVMPDYVWSLMPPSWFTDELIEYVGVAVAEFEVL